MVFKTLDSFPKGKTCQLCLTSKIDPAILGNICQAGNVIVHYYCLLLASKIEQKGSDNQGLLGFFPKDIKKEITRGRTIVCTYCKKKGATVKCCGENCHLNFHVPCAQENGSLHQYYAEFKSFCAKHKPRQKIPEKIRKSRDLECLLCCSPIRFNCGSYNDEPLWPLCCKPRTFLHKRCTQLFATTSGYYFKCPFCNSRNAFCEAMRTFGIYIPEQEASWESEPNAYSELQGMFVRCIARICRCPRGRDYNLRNSKWFLEVCSSCGTAGQHRSCMPEPLPNGIYECSVCAEVSSRYTEAVTSRDRDREADNSLISNGEVLNETLQQPGQDNISKTTSIECGEDIVVISDSESEEVDVEGINEIPAHVKNLRKRQHGTLQSRRPRQKRQRLAECGAETSSEIRFTIQEENGRHLPHVRDDVRDSLTLVNISNHDEPFEINPLNNDHISEHTSSSEPLDEENFFGGQSALLISKVCTLSDCNPAEINEIMCCDEINNVQDPNTQKAPNIIDLSSDNEDDDIFVISDSDGDDASVTSSLLGSESSLLDLSEIPESERSLLLDHFSNHNVDNENTSSTIEKPKRRRKKKKLYTRTKKRKYDYSTKEKGKSNQRSIESYNGRLLDKSSDPTKDLDRNLISSNSPHFSDLANNSFNNLSSVPNSQVNVLSIEHSIYGSKTKETINLATVDKSIIVSSTTLENMDTGLQNSVTHDSNIDINNDNEQNHKIVCTSDNNEVFDSLSNNGNNNVQPTNENSTINDTKNTFLHIVEVHMPVDSELLEPPDKVVNHNFASKNIKPSNNESLNLKTCSLLVGTGDATSISSTVNKSFLVEDLASNYKQTSLNSVYSNDVLEINNESVLAKHFIPHEGIKKNNAVELSGFINKSNDINSSLIFNKPSQIEGLISNPTNTSLKNIYFSEDGVGTVEIERNNDSILADHFISHENIEENNAVEVLDYINNPTGNNSTLNKTSQIEVLTSNDTNTSLKEIHSNEDGADLDRNSESVFLEHSNPHKQNTALEVCDLMNNTITSQIEGLTSSGTNISLKDIHFNDNIVETMERNHEPICPQHSSPNVSLKEGTTSEISNNSTVIHEPINITTNLSNKSNINIRRNNSEPSANNSTEPYNTAKAMLRNEKEKKKEKLKIMCSLALKQPLINSLKNLNSNQNFTTKDYLEKSTLTFEENNSGLINNLECSNGGSAVSSELYLIDNQVEAQSSKLKLSPLELNALEEESQINSSVVTESEFTKLKLNSKTQKEFRSSKPNHLDQVEVLSSTPVSEKHMVMKSSKLNTRDIMELKPTTSIPSGSQTEMQSSVASSSKNRLRKLRIGKQSPSKHKMKLRLKSSKIRSLENHGVSESPKFNPLEDQLGVKLVESSPKHTVEMQLSSSNASNDQVLLERSKLILSEDKFYLQSSTQSSPSQEKLRVTKVNRSNTVEIQSSKKQIDLSSKLDPKCSVETSAKAQRKSKSSTLNSSNEQVELQQTKLNLTSYKLDSQTTALSPKIPVKLLTEQPSESQVELLLSEANSYRQVKLQSSTTSDDQNELQISERISHDNQDEFQNSASPSGEKLDVECTKLNLHEDQVDLDSSEHYLGKEIEINSNDASHIEKQNNFLQNKEEKLIKEKSVEIITHVDKQIGDCKSSTSINKIVPNSISEINNRPHVETVLSTPHSDIKKPKWYNICNTDCPTCQNSTELIMKENILIGPSNSACFLCKNTQTSNASSKCNCTKANNDFKFDCSSVVEQNYYVGSSEIITEEAKLLLYNLPDVVLSAEKINLKCQRYSLPDLESILASNHNYITTNSNKNSSEIKKVEHQQNFLNFKLSVSNVLSKNPSLLISPKRNTLLDNIEVQKEIKNTVCQKEKTSEDSIMLKKKLNNFKCTVHLSHEQSINNSSLSFKKELDSDKYNTSVMKDCDKCCSSISNMDSIITATNHLPKLNTNLLSVNDKEENFYLLPHCSFTGSNEETSLKVETNLTETDNSESSSKRDR